MKPKVIKDFPGEEVEEYRKAHKGALPSKNICPICKSRDPEQAAKDLLLGIENGLTGDKLLAFARRSFEY